ncbi:MAG: hypothetical protein U9O64_03485 [Campylobacterota bacterium]|nr:hypothetical protein [Campylobacterota bacterium]
MLIASVGLVFGLMTGCGGGSDDDSGIIDPTTGLEEDKVNEFVGDIADELGCTYTEVTTSQSIETDITSSLETVEVLKKVAISGKSVIELAETPIISATEPGTCGGTIEIPDNFLDTMTGTISLTNYCMIDEESGVETTINGSVAVAVDETSGLITVSTPTPLTIVSSSPETGNPVNITINLDNATLAISEDESMQFTITALTVTDNVTNKVYTITNFTADVVGDMLTFNGTFNNPDEIGTVSVVGSINSATGEGTITATDQDGVEVKLSTTENEGVFDVSFDGAPLGTMDCTTVDIPTVPTI